MNPIKGEELYEDDGTIRRLIADLKELQATYKSMVEGIRSEAGKVKKALEDQAKAGTATKKTQDEAAKQADQLARQQEKYQASLTDTGREIVRLRSLQTKKNQLTRAEIRLANSAEGSYDRLSAQYSINKIRLNAMSSAMRQGTAEGRKLEKQTKDIYEEMKRLQEATGKTALSVGDYRGAIKDAFSDLGSAALGPAAVGAAVAGAAIQLGQYTAELGTEIRNIRGQVSTLVSGSAEEIDSFTARIRAAGAAFGEDENGILQAANAVSQQLGISFDDALTKIEEGFIGGSNISGEFLDSLREYPAFFREAGLSADALFQVINQTAKEGIYSDKGVDAIKEATIRLREQPQAAKDALQAIGLSSVQIGEIIEKEGIGAAIATVSTRLGELEDNSPAVGQAIAGIFGGAGEDAGLAFLRSLKDINEATGSVIDSTNEYQKQQAEILKVNQELAEAQNEVVEALGLTGGGFETLKARGETLLFRVLAPVIEAFKVLWDATLPLRDGLFRIYESLGLVGKEGTLLEGILNLIVIAARAVAVPVQAFATILGFLYDRIADVIDIGRSFLEWLGVVGKEQEKAESAARGMGRGNREAYEELRKQEEQQRKTTTTTRQATKAMTDFGDATKQANEETKKLAEGSLGALQQKVSQLRDSLKEATPENQLGIIQDLRLAENELKELVDYIDGVRDRLDSDPITIQVGLSAADVSVKNLQERAAKTLKDRGSDIIPVQREGNKDIFELLGFEVSDEKKEAIGSAFNFAKQQVLELARLRTQLATQRLDEANEDVSSAEAALQAELSRNEQGLASNIETRRRDLENAQEVQAKAREEQRRAQRAEQRLQTIQQAANLVTASAKIWGQLGFPAAIPAIALMFGSFIATKARAARLARQENRRGTFQFLRGGSSHGTGRDISLGVDDRGVEQLAERGESFAVLPAGATRQYRDVLPSLFDAISNGQLNKWVEQQGRRGELASLPGGVSMPDNSAMEGGINRIAANTSRRVYQDAEGNTVIEQGYNRTIIRRA